MSRACIQEIGGIYRGEHGSCWFITDITCFRGRCDLVTLVRVDINKFAGTYSLVVKIREGHGCSCGDAAGICEFGCDQKSVGEYSQHPEIDAGKKTERNLALKDDKDLSRHVQAM